jgi:hypothetical protein
MQDQLTEAAVRAADHGAPDKAWHVGPDAAVDYGTGCNPFDGITITHWTVD